MTGVYAAPCAGDIRQVHLHGNKKREENSFDLSKKNRMLLIPFLDSVWGERRIPSGLIALETCKSSYALIISKVQRGVTADSFLKWSFYPSQIHCQYCFYALRRCRNSPLAIICSWSNGAIDFKHASSISSIFWRAMATFAVILRINDNMLHLRWESHCYSCPVCTHVPASACFHKGIFKMCVQAKVGPSQKANASFAIVS